MSGFDGEALTAQALDELQASVDRDPRDCSWGLFAWGDAPPACGGGVGAFQWFASQEELMAFISEWSTPCFMTFDDEAEWRDQCVGGFADLRNSQDSFCLRVQAAFAEADPAGADDDEAWVDFLGMYGL